MSATGGTTVEGDNPTPGKSLSAFLTRLVLLGMVPLMILGIWRATVEVRGIRGDQRREAADIAQDFADTLDQQLSERIRALQMLAASPLVNDRARWPELYREAESFREYFGSHVILADPAGRMLLNTRVAFGAALPQLPSIQGRASFPTAMKTLRPAVSDGFMGPVAKELLVSITVPVLRQGRPVYGLLTTLEARQFQDRLGAVKLPKGWAVTLLDGTGDILARRAMPGLDTAKDVDPAGRFQIKSGLSGWLVVVEIPRQVWRAPLLQAAAGLSAASLVAVLAGLLVGAHSSRRIANAVAVIGAETGLALAAPKFREIAAVRGRLDAAAREREASEATSRASRATLQAALASMNDAVFISDAEGRFLHLNEAFATFHRFSNKDECARTFAEYPEILDVFLPDGQVAPVEQWAVSRALRGETATHAEYTLRRKDTGETWVGSYSFAPIRDEAGVIVGSVVAGRDITEQKHSQEEILRLNTSLERRVEERTAELRAANHELEAFCYAVSHDLRAPLRAMSGFTQALVEDHGAIQPPEARTYLDQIVLGSQRMGDLIDGLLTLSRSTLGDLRREPVDLSALAGIVKAELERGDPARRVAWQIEPGLWAHGDSRMLLAALRNLLGNAWKYTVHQAAPAIVFDAIEQEGARVFRVSDNGAGFDMAYAAKLFHPFQRLHRQDEFPGLGIGLATVQRIIHRHGGRITAQSQPGQGATFQFTIPAASEEFPS